MSLGLIGQKIGMSRVFEASGGSIPVTVISVEPNRITQVKSLAVDGYCSVQVTVGKRRSNRVNKPMAGHFAKASVEPGRGLWEFRLEEVELGELAAGQEITVTQFSEGQDVDVSGASIGKGFAGVVKRHHFRGGRATHGNSLAHRKAGSIGQNQDPGRVFPGKKMAGHMGNERRTQQNLKIVRIDEARNLILVKGSVPGPKGLDVEIRASIKSPTSKA